jgi:hypothetical protein
MRRRALLGASLGLIAMAVVGGPANASGALADGDKLTDFLDGLNVESLWLAGAHVNWETGEPDGVAESDEGKHTHCSAFVAAAAERLGVYVLRPPEHRQTLLANAQYDWLRDHGAEQGWSPVADGYAAQRAANRGFLVAASYKNHLADKPGHIAIVRPSGKSRDAILADGPEIIMAGGHNYNATTARHGFADHPSAFSGNEIAYYQHDLP